jgi:hypothetical protein
LPEDPVPVQPARSGPVTDTAAAVFRNVRRPTDTVGLMYMNVASTKE